MTAPSTIPGYDLRPLGEGDTEAVRDLFLDVHRAEGLEEEPELGPAEWILGAPDLDRASDTLVAVDADGAVAGLIASWAQVTDSGSRSFLISETAPGRPPHLARGLLDWGIARACTQLSGGAPGTEAVIRIVVEEHRSAKRDLVEAEGFRPARVFARMTCPLVPPPAPPGRPPAGITVVPWDNDHDLMARHIVNDAFARHWGSLPLTQEQWRHRYLDDETFRRDLSFVAVDENTPIGLVLSEVEDGAAELYVGRLAILPDHQRRGVGAHLLRLALQAGADAGLRRAALHVDASDSQTALSLYERHGFTVANRSIHYTMPGR